MIKKVLLVLLFFILILDIYGQNKKLGSRILNPVAVPAFERAQEFFEKSNYDQAIIEYTKVLNIQANYVDALWMRGLAYDRKGDYDNAIADYTTAIQIDPKNNTLYSNRGLAYNRKSEYDNAIADFTAALKIFPKAATYLNNRGIAYYNKGDYDNAIADYTAAIKINSKDASCFNNRGIAYEKKGEKEKAIADYNAALKLNPNYTQAKNGLARVQGGGTVAQSNTQQQSQNQNQQAKTSTSEPDYRAEITQDSKSVVNVTEGTSLVEKLQWLQVNAVSNTQYRIEVTRIERIDPQILSYKGKTGINIIISGDSEERIIALTSNGTLFTIESGVTLILEKNISLQGRNSNNISLVKINNGGRLFINNDAKISNNTLTSSDSCGSGVYVDSNASLIMRGGEISGNKSSSKGGGVFINSNGTFLMEDGLINGNTAKVGGGIHIEGGYFKMTGGEINNNTGDGVSIIDFHAKGQYQQRGNFIMVNGKINGNKASREGGGVYVAEHSNFTMKDGEISNNIGPGVKITSSAAVFSYFADFTMDGGKISNNTSVAGVHVWSGGVFTMNNGEISSNADSGVYVDTYTGSHGNFTMNGGEIKENHKTGVQVRGIFTMNSGKISGNRSYSSGNFRMEGGVFVEGGNFTMKGGEIFNNATSGVYIKNYLDIRGGNFLMEGGTIYGNTAAFGGGVFIERGNFTMNGGEILKNTASSSGGGVYVHSVGSFVKTNGTIYGFSNGDNNSNKASRGHAVFVVSENRFRNSTADSRIMLDTELSGVAGGWEN